jgi:hypothetical protein
LRGLLGEIAGGLIGDLDAWRHMLKTGEIPPEIAELDEQARRRWSQPGEEQ